MAASEQAMRALGTTLGVKAGADATEIVIGKLSSIGEITVDSEEIDVTALDSTGGYREYIQGFKDSGELSLTGFYAPGNAGQAKMQTLYGSGEKAAWTVTFPDGTTAAFSGYVKSVTVGSAEVDGAVGFGAAVRISGAVTFGAGA